jgi:hypothetical protein
MLQSLEIKNFTVFEEAKLEFSAGLNIIVGENGTGKTHLLKLGYVLELFTFYKTNFSTYGRLASNLGDSVISVFRPEYLSRLIRKYRKNCELKVKIFGAEVFECSFNTDSISNIWTTFGSDNSFSVLRPLFIPTREIISIYTGFAAALRNRELEFDSTFLDLADALALTPLKGDQVEKIRPVIASLEKQMNGKIIVENGRFYINTDKSRFEMPLVAEGIRKIAMLAYLIMNGSIQKGSTVFWDEPESNLNPKMMVQLAETLVTLSSMGIQIILATHSLFLLRELKIQSLRHPELPTRYFALKPEKQGVSVHQGDSMEELDPIAALDADLEQSERYLELE